MSVPPLPHVCLGTRGSVLARWQTRHVEELLKQAWPGLTTETRVIATSGDLSDRPLPSIGGKGLFTAELEAALRDGDIDLAVHSLKDLPTAPSPGLALGAILPREDERDALVSRLGCSLNELPKGAAMGTSSRRRAAQVLALRPDLRILDLRGNADTRLRKALEPDGPYDAIVVAAAALARLGRLEDASELVEPGVLLPAPGQGALAVQCRDEAAALALLAAIHDPASAATTAAERAFLDGLGGGCAVPIAAHASLDPEGMLTLHGRVCAVDGSRIIDVSAAENVLRDEEPSAQAAWSLGLRLAEEARAQGAAEMLEET